MLQTRIFCKRNSMQEQSKCWERTIFENVRFFWLNDIYLKKECAISMFILKHTAFFCWCCCSPRHRGKKCSNKFIRKGLCFINLIFFLLVVCNNKIVVFYQNISIKLEFVHLISSCLLK